MLSHTLNIILFTFFICSYSAAQESVIEYDANTFHDTILELYTVEMEYQEEQYIEFLRKRLDNSILDMRDYDGYSISKWEDINRDEEAEREGEMYIFLGIVLLFLLLFYLYRLKHKWNSTAWEDGVIPKDFEYSEDNLMEAYLRLAGMMMRYDKDNPKEKIAYAHRYFAKHFPSSEIDFPSILKEAFKNPVKLEVAAAWLITHLTKPERIQVLYFLAGLAVVDGDFNHSEKAIIIKFSELLELSKKDLDSILSMYAGYERKNKKHSENRTRAKIKSKLSETERCSKVLGVSQHARMDEIKKAYRQLVKVHHPDRFATAPKSQQKIAEERFIKIQEAYEYLESIK